MIYSVRHVTKFSYTPAVRESVMEVRMHPRSEANQRCLTFELNLKPSAALMQYRDFLGNIVHHFDIAGSHTQLKLDAQSTVEVLPIHEPDVAHAGSWEELDAMVATDGYYEMMLPSTFARPSNLLGDFAREMELERRFTPLRRIPCLGRGPTARPRLGRHRSHQQSAMWRTPHPGSHRPRLRRSAPHPRSI